MSKISLKDARLTKSTFKCPDCPARYDNINVLIEHVETSHADYIPDGVTTRQYIFNRKYKKTTGSCVMCKKPTPWNEARGRYERFDRDVCVKAMREQFKKNARRKLGTENPASTVEHQIKAIKGRSYSGEYTFTDGGVIGYSSSYEKDFLEFCDKEMELPSSEVAQCEIIFEYVLNGKLTFHIPDYIIPMYNLVIQIKTWKNMNSHVQTTGKLRQRLADKAIIDNGNYNYITIIDMDYGDFVNIMKLLKERKFSEKGNSPDDVIICIPKY